MSRGSTKTDIVKSQIAQFVTNHLGGEFPKENKQFNAGDSFIILGPVKEGDPSNHYFDGYRIWCGKGEQNDGKINFMEIGGSIYDFSPKDGQQNSMEDFSRAFDEFAAEYEQKNPVTAQAAAAVKVGELQSSRRIDLDISAHEGIDIGKEKDLHNFEQTSILEPPFNPFLKKVSDESVIGVDVIASQSRILVNEPGHSSFSDTVTTAGLVNKFIDKVRSKSSDPEQASDENSRASKVGNLQNSRERDEQGAPAESVKDIAGQIKEEQAARSGAVPPDLRTQGTVSKAHEGSEASIRSSFLDKILAEGPKRAERASGGVPEIGGDMGKSATGPVVGRATAALAARAAEARKGDDGRGA